jgi:DNA primase
MKKIPRYVDFKLVKKTVSMEQILEHYGLLETLTRKGDSLSGRNPFDHESTNPTRFRVSLSKNCWNIFGSDLGGNVLDFVVAMESCDLKTAAKHLQDWFNLEPGALPKKPITPPTKPKVQQEKDESEPRVNSLLSFELNHLDPDHEYLSERGFTSECIQHFGLGFCEKGIMGGRIAIPIRNVQAQLVGYIGRWPGEPPKGEARYKLPKGFHKSNELYNIHTVHEFNCSDAVLILVEGVFDCMRLWQLGYLCVAAVLGSELSDAQVSLLTEAWQGRILVMFDQDDAGLNGANKAIQKLCSHHWVRVAHLPEPNMQPDHFDQARFHQSLKEYGIDIH